MKRFFCTVCTRVKRVRNLPTLTPDSYGGEDGKTLQPDPKNRLGKCRFHNSPFVSRRSQNDHTRRDNSREVRL